MVKDDEQERGLLEEWKSHPNDGHGVSGKRWTTSGTAIFVGAVFAFLAALGVVGYALFGAEIRPRDKIVSAPGVRKNDYILDPAWDFDAAPRRRLFNWTIRDQDHNPDGIYRAMLLVNNQFPGPLVEANEGDTIVVIVNNQAANATSIHWHGLYQNGTSHLDGTVGVTQCPIAPGILLCRYRSIPDPVLSIARRPFLHV